MASSLLTRVRVLPSSGESHNCLVCCKDFPSRRALNGHMRVHGGHGSTDPFGSKFFSESSLLRKFWTSDAPLMEEEFEYYNGQDEGDESKAEEVGELEPEGRSLEMYNVKKCNSTLTGVPFGDRSNLQSGERASLVCVLRENPKKNPLLTDKDYVCAHEYDHLSNLYTCNEAMCAKTFVTHRGLLQHMQRHADRVSSPGHAFRLKSTVVDMSSSEVVDLCVERDGIMVCPIPCSILNHCKQKIGTDGRHDHMHDVQQPFSTCFVRTSSYEPALASTSILSFTAEEENQSHSTFATNCALREVEAAVTLMMLSEGLTDRVNASEWSTSAAAPQPGSMHNLKNTNRMQGADKFECQVCGKRFSSYQALGGHTAMHMKLNRSKTAEERPTKDLDTEQGHKCPICHRVFSKGQALGGHMRRHWTNDGARNT